MNISSKYGGTLSQPRGYTKVSDTLEEAEAAVPLVAFNEVLDPSGKPYAGMPIDDIGAQNGEFLFSGYRKVLELFSLTPNKLV